MKENVVFRLNKQNLANDTVMSGTDWSETLGYASFGASSRRASESPGYKSGHRLSQITRMTDGVVIAIVTLLSAEIESGFLTHRQASVDAVANLVAALVFFLTYRSARTSRYRRSLEGFCFLLLPLILASAVRAEVSSSLGATGPVLLQTSTIWIAAAVGGLTASRGITAIALQHPTIKHRLTQRIAVIGNDIHAFSVAERLRTESPDNIEIVGIFSDSPQRNWHSSINGAVSDLIDLSQDTNLHGIVIALPKGDESETQLPKLSLRLRGVLADVFVMPYLVHGPDVVLPMQFLGSTPLLVLRRRPLDGWQTFYKRILDFTLCLFAFFLLFPLLAIVSVIIKIDSRGPVLFRQPRRGFNNRPFTVFKFRTMYVNATDLFAAKQTSRDDPRVTRVGKWLRRLSVDELPQLLNVLRGEMSLVGPRPHALQTRVEGVLLNDAISEYLIRYQVKPGITGWAQINGARGELVTREDLRRRVTLDLDYIKYWSIRFDLKIIFLTAIREVFSKNAF